MARNMQKRQRQKLSLDKELELFMEMVHEKQRDKQVRMNFREVKNDLSAEKDYLEKLSP
jgi:hypothetical protein